MRIKRENCVKEIFVPTKLFLDEDIQMHEIVNFSKQAPVEFFFRQVNGRGFDQELIGRSIGTYAKV